MTNHDDLKAAAAAAAEAILVAVLTIPAVTHFAANTRLFRPGSYGTISGFYEDDDGEATEASTRECSDLPSRIAAWLSSSLGLAASIAAALVSHDVQHASSLSRFLCTWADVLAWVSLLASILCPRPLADTF